MIKKLPISVDEFLQWRKMGGEGMVLIATQD